MLQLAGKAQSLRIKGAERRGRRLDKAERKQAVDRVAAVLIRGQPTQFAFEAACRHDLRAGLCLNGMAWSRADTTAADIVSEALALIGAERPTWNQGQPWWTDSAATWFLRTNCMRCGKLLPELKRVTDRRYCSQSCAVGAYNDKHIADKRAYDLARWHALKAAAPDTSCEECGGTFKSLRKAGRPIARFCSNACYHRARKRKKLIQRTVEFSSRSALGEDLAQRVGDQARQLLT
jgi:hypothetical protein